MWVSAALQQREPQAPQILSNKNPNNNIQWAQCKPYVSCWIYFAPLTFLCAERLEGEAQSFHSLF